MVPDVSKAYVAVLFNRLRCKKNDLNPSDSKRSKSSIAPLRTPQKQHRPLIIFADMEKILENENRH